MKKRIIASIMFMCLIFTSTIGVMPLQVYADDKEYYNPGDNFTRTQYFLSNKLKITNPVLYTTNEGGGQGIFIADVENISAASTGVETFDIVFYDENYEQLKQLGGMISPTNPGKSTQVSISWTRVDEFEEKIRYYQLICDNTGEVSSLNYVWDGVKKTEVISVSDTYTIDSSDELAWFAQEVNLGNAFTGKSIFITGEMNLGNKTWEPIGNGKILECSIEIKDCHISGMTSNVLNNGLFGNVSVKKFVVDNLRIDNTFITKNVWDTHNLGLLVGALTIPVDGYLKVSNSQFKGSLSNTHSFDEGATGGIIGRLSFEAENGYAIFENNVVEASISGSNTVGGIIGTLVDGSLVGVLDIKKCYVDCDISASNSYGYENTKAGGLIGTLNGHSVSINQCIIKGKISSVAYEGWCGGLVGHAIYNNLQISDCAVQANINSIFGGWYGSKYNGGGFLGFSHCNDNTDSFIKNSYFNGPINSGAAFVTRDNNAGDSSIPIINCYFDMDKTGLDADMMHSYGKYAGLMTNMLSGCVGYTTEQMQEEANFINWDFKRIWTLENDDFPQLYYLYNDEQAGGNEEGTEGSKYIIKCVSEYTSDEIYAQYKEIDGGNYSQETKSRLLYELFLTYGFINPKEGIEYLSNISGKRYAYLYLTNDEIYCATTFKYWLDNTLDGKMMKAKLCLDGLLLAGELNEWFDFSTYLESDYPDVAKYKNMLYEFMDSAKDSVEVKGYVKFISDVSDNVTGVAKIRAEELIEKLNKCDTAESAKNLLNTIESKGILVELSKNQDVEGPLYEFKLDESSGFGKFAKEMGVSMKVLNFIDMSLTDLFDIVELDSKLAIYSQYTRFLNEILDNTKLPFEMRWAASQIIEEIEIGYLGTGLTKLVLDIVNEVEITDIVKDGLFEKYGISSFGTCLETIGIASFFVNKLTGIGQMVKKSSQVEGYALLSYEYSKKLEMAKENFIANPTEENAWEFYYNYNILYQLRCKGEEAYLGMSKVGGILQCFSDFGYSMKEEGVKETLKTLENRCKFELDDIEKIPESCQFASKAVVRCPVDVEVYSPTGELIVILYDGIEYDEVNEYGRFSVIYNVYTQDFVKVMCFNKHDDYNFKIIGKDAGLVNMDYCEKGEYNSENYFFRNVPITENMLFETSATLIVEKNIYNIDIGRDGIFDEVGTFEIEKENFSLIEDLELDKEEITLKIGESILFGVIIKPFDTSQRNVEWITGNEDIVVIQNGKATAVGNGETYIYCRSSNNLDIVAKCKVIVKSDITISALDQIILWGSNIDHSKYQVSGDGLAEGDRIDSLILTPSTAEITTTGIIEMSSITIVNEDGQDVTDNYSITYIPANLVIEHDTNLSPVKLEVLKTTVEYMIGEVLTVDDIIVIAHYEDGYIEEVTDYITNVDDIDMTAVGDKTLTVSYTNNGTVTKDIFITVGRGYEVKLPSEQIGYSITADAEEVLWNGNVTFTFKLADGYTKTDDFLIKVNGNAVILGEDGTYTMTNVLEEINITVEGVADVTAPTVEIKVKENGWTKFLNIITFGIFFKEIQDVTVSASDVNTGSGMDKVYYYISDEVMSEDDVRALKSWTEYDEKFSITSDNTYVIYVKAVDKAGNITYASTDGLVMDEVLPVITGIEDKGIYYEEVIFSVMDVYLDKVYVDDEEVILTDGKYKIYADNKEHIIKVIDKANNEICYTITVKIPNVVYEILDVKDIVWDGNEAGIVIRGSGELSKFMDVKVDGFVIDKGYYRVEDGSTIIYLSASYLEKLSVGTHTIELLWSDGSVTTVLHILDKSIIISPETGDQTVFFFWIILLNLSFVAFLFSYKLKSKTKK